MLQTLHVGFPLKFHSETLKIPPLGESVPLCAKNIGHTIWVLLDQRLDVENEAMFLYSSWRKLRVQSLPDL